MQRLEMRSMRPGHFVVAFAVLAAAPSHLISQEAGSWTMRLAVPPEAGIDKVETHLALRTPGLNTRYVEFESLHGLTRAQVTSTTDVITFRLKEDAGTLRFTGAFKDGRGHGSFFFEPDPAFAAELKRRGMDAPTVDQQLDFARHDIGFALLDELAKQGYRQPTTREFLAAGINGLDASYVGEMARLGYKLGSLDALMKLRLESIDPEYARAMTQRAGRQLTASELFDLRMKGER